MGRRIGHTWGRKEACDIITTEGDFIMSEVSIPKIRKSVRAHTGSEVKVRAVNGEEKVEIARGVISETYPSVFVIARDSQESICGQKISFSYCDILTREIELSLCC